MIVFFSSFFFFDDYQNDLLRNITQLSNKIHMVPLEGLWNVVSYNFWNRTNSVSSMRNGRKYCKLAYLR